MSTSETGNAAVVSTQNSADNATIADVVGNKTDTVLGNSLYSFAVRQDVESHGVMQVYPTLALGVPIVSKNTVWEYGTITEIVPANAINSPFYILNVALEASDEDGVFQLALYQGASDVLIMTLRYSVAGGFFGNAIMWTTSSALIAAGSRIRGQLASSDGLANQCTQRISIAYRF